MTDHTRTTISRTQDARTDAATYTATCFACDGLAVTGPRFGVDAATASHSARTGHATASWPAR